MNTLFNITLKAEPQVKEYRLMYLFGAWVTKAIIAAETDEEAIYDATEVYAESRLQDWKYGVALFCGNHLVKRFN